jgi:hypothetical protein
MLFHFVVRGFRDVSVSSAVSCSLVILSEAKDLLFLVILSEAKDLLFNLELAFAGVMTPIQ